jgi:hypothetical protein
MYIANPIYDTSFKFLMEDHESAVLFLSTIIGEEIEELEFLPQEYASMRRDASGDNGGKEGKGDKGDKGGKGSEDALVHVSMLRMDFRARIKTSDGRVKSVAIELQKTRMPLDVMRFRRYLASQLSNPGPMVDGKPGRPLELYCIYLLGERYGDICPGHPVLVVGADVRDAATGERVEEKLEFVSVLYQRSWIVQLELLPEVPGTAMERLLSVFDQRRCIDGSARVLDVGMGMDAEDFGRIVRRLHMVCGSDVLFRSMEEEEFRRWDVLELEGNLEKKNKVIAEKDNALEENKRAMEENKKAMEENKKALEENKKALADALAELRRLKGE